MTGHRTLIVVLLWLASCKDGKNYPPIGEATPCPSGTCGYSLCAAQLAAEGDGGPFTRTYDVRVDGSGDFTTIQACADAVNPGELCLVHPGNYGRTRIQRGGAEGAPVVFRAASPLDTSRADFSATYDPANPVITPASPLNAVTKGFSIEAGFVRVEGFEVTNLETTGEQLMGRGAIYLDDCHDVEVIHNFIHDSNAAPNSYNYGGIRGDAHNTQRIRVAHNLVFRNQGTGITLVGDSWLVECNDVSHTLDNNTDSGTEVGGDSDATRFFGANHIIRNNYLHDLLDQEQVGNPHIDAFQVFSVYPDSQYAHDILIEGNYVYRSGQMFMGSDEGETENVNPVHDITFRNNVFRNTRAVALIISQGLDYVTVNHNVITEAWYSPISVSGGSHHANVQNNIFYLNSRDTPDMPTGQVLGDASSQFGSVWDYNLHYPDFTYPDKLPQYDVHGFYGVDPLFMDPEAGDFRSIGSSQVCGAANDGTDIGAFPCVRCTDQTPVPYAKLDRRTGWEPLLVDLDGSYSLPCGDSPTYTWDFGDGQTASGAHVSHTFSAGTHPVKLQVANGSGASASVTKTVVVTASVLPNLVLGLHLDGSAEDWSGKGNTVSVEQGTATYLAGKFGQALSLDGTSSGPYARVGYQYVLDDVPALTLACWARRSSAGAAGDLIYKHVTYGLTLTTDGVQARVATASGEESVSFSVAATDTSWHHYAATYDGSTLRLYLDGTSVAQVPLTGRVARHPDREITIGRDPWDASLSGEIDEVRIYDRALSDAEVQALQNPP